MFNVSSTGRGPSLRVGKNAAARRRTAAGGPRLRLRQPVSEASERFDEVSEASSPFERPITPRDAFGQPSDSDTDSECSMSSPSASGAGDDDIDEASMLANRERMRPARAPGAPAPRPAAPQISTVPSRPRSAAPSMRQPDFMGVAQDDGFVGPPEETLDNVKLELLHKIQRMAASSGLKPELALSMESPYEQINAEYQRMRRSQEINRSIKFQRRVLLATATGVEFLSKRMPFIKLHLDGFAEAQMDSIADYDDAFESLHERHGDSVRVDPMYTVLFMFMSSIVAYHLSNAMFSSVLPSVSQTLANNPNIMSQVADAMKGLTGTPGAATGLPGLTATPEGGPSASAPPAMPPPSGGPRFPPAPPAPTAPSSMMPPPPPMQQPGAPPQMMYQRGPAPPASGMPQPPPPPGMAPSARMPVQPFPPPPSSSGVAAPRPGMGAMIDPPAATRVERVTEDLLTGDVLRVPPPGGAAGPSTATGADDAASEVSEVSEGGTKRRVRKPREGTLVL